MPFTDAIYADQQVVTASAVALAAGGQIGSGVTIRAKDTNVGKVFIGGSTVTATDDGTGNGWALPAGASLSLPVNLVQAAFIIGTAGDVVYVIGA